MISFWSPFPANFGEEPQDWLLLLGSLGSAFHGVSSWVNRQKSYRHVSLMALNRSIATAKSSLAANSLKNGQRNHRQRSTLRQTCRSASTRDAHIFYPAIELESVLQVRQTLRAEIIEQIRWQSSTDNTVCRSQRGQP